MQNDILPNDILKDWLRPVQDPELFLSIVDLGLIYTVTVDNEGKAIVEMTLTSPGCPAGDYLVSEIKKRLLEYKGSAPESLPVIAPIKEVDVKIVWEPKWDPAVMASDECKEALGIW